ncbi:MAG TPA: DNA methyltransferase [Kouleothrix sp.]|uniref:DNA methyltransferase n=1 Tax=Kouleothrix sp. TaxID=2779161 RepID=UPI002BD7B4CF|nr:DNA methyltransferase [Kouleothrix sp.]HRC76501.1 DNA methyltransferase [Kouleothrix sp.]
MRTFLRLKNQQPGHLPPEFAGEELRYPEELVGTFLRQFTRPGQAVLDPFAGYGTTLVVAEAMGRAGFGVEPDARRVRYARARLAHSERLVHGDARALGQYALPPIDFCMASPPFMAHDEAENVISGERRADAYASYLADIARVYAGLAPLLRPGARAVIEVANLKGPGGTTMLAWDVARAVAQALTFEGEVVIGWDRYDYGYDHSYCLVFRA